MSDEEWAFCAPYQTLMREDAPQREHSLRSLFTGLRSLVRGLPRDTESVLVWRTGLGRVVPSKYQPGARSGVGSADEVTVGDNGQGFF